MLCIPNQLDVADIILLFCAVTISSLIILDIRTDNRLAQDLETLFTELGLPSFSELVRSICKAASSNKDHQKTELTVFVAKRDKIERSPQRYEYFVARKFALEATGKIRTLDEEESCELKNAGREVWRLPREVYELVQGVENYTMQTSGNPWVRGYIASVEERSLNADRSECSRRLGCCAAGCGSCRRPPRKRGGKGGGGGQEFVRATPDDGPSKTYMRLASEMYPRYRAHCSVDCACCIQRRGVVVG